MDRELNTFGKSLFVLDLANNHFGDVDHALRTIDSLAKELTPLGQSVAIKFQLRDLDSYIHPEFKTRTDLHYVKRFLDTRLTIDEFKKINEHAKNCGFLTMATPFDELSCSVFADIDFDIAKVASASSNDFVLMKAIADLGKPTVASTGGLTENEIMRLHEFMTSRLSQFALMHCVSIYPCPDHALSLRQILNLRGLFPETPIGWSTHENPDNMLPIAMVCGLGATIFERHVGMNSDDYKINGYSSTPDVVRRWIETALFAEEMAGSLERLPASDSELDSLSQLKRGIYAKRPILAGTQLSSEDFYPAYPLAPGGFDSGSLEVGSIVATHDIAVDAPLLKASTSKSQNNQNLIEEYLIQIKKIVNRSLVPINRDAKLELSHHYGVSRFREFGTAMFTCINRNYAKKILVMLPRQKHPMHRHDIKEESFQLLWGDLQISVNGEPKVMEVGEIITVYPKEWHKFSSLNGCVLEEISTHHSPGDSYYDDAAIQSTDVSSRKTHVNGFFRQK